MKRENPFEREKLNAKATKGFASSEGMLGFNAAISSDWWHPEGPSANLRPHNPQSHRLAKHRVDLIHGVADLIQLPPACQTVTDGRDVVRCGEPFNQGTRDHASRSIGLGTIFFQHPKSFRPLFRAGPL